MAATVLEALRQFLPKFLKTAPSLSAEQRSALWAINHCRTPALGGRAFACTNPNCSQVHFAWHSCNHKACPQCGRAATAQWVQRELGKLLNAPFFLVTSPCLSNCAAVSSARTPRRPTTCSSRPWPRRSRKNWRAKACARPSTVLPPRSTPGTSNWAFIRTSTAGEKPVRTTIYPDADGVLRVAELDQFIR